MMGTAEMTTPAICSERVGTVTSASILLARLSISRSTTCSVRRLEVEMYDGAEEAGEKRHHPSR